MVLQDALKNINIVIRGVRMTADEHDALKESINIIITHIKSLEEKIQEYEKEVE